MKKKRNGVNAKETTSQIKMTYGLKMRNLVSITEIKFYFAFSCSKLYWTDRGFPPADHKVDL